MTDARCLLLAVTLMLAACEGSSRDDVVAARGSNASTDCSGHCANASTFLTADDVTQVIEQGVAQAQAAGVGATLAVVDRVGNVLAVFRSNAVPLGGGSAVLIRSGDRAGAIDGGLEDLRFPIDTSVPSDGLAAIAKALTGAYLSSEGNAFSTRVASQIVQDHFNPGEENQPGGPLFGVQFSQLPCSDFSLRASDGSPGPKRSPLGLSADPGGFPLYKNGTPVGGVGVISGDFRYGLDKVPTDFDRDNDELIALAASFGFVAPRDREAGRITVDGKTLRFSDVDFEDLDVAPGSRVTNAITTAGSLISVTSYYDAAGGVLVGEAFGQNSSGIAADSSSLFPGRDAFLFVNGAGVNRFPPSAGSSLSAAEVQALLDEALAVANRARAQIRRPLGSQARVTVSVVDTDGSILGMARSRDAPVFGADVSLQKARTATLFSSTSAASFLSALPNTQYLNPDLSPKREVVINDYVQAVKTTFGDQSALQNGIAFADRSGGNLARPYFPDGIDANTHGPLSKPRGEWSVFSTGLQLDMVLNAVTSHVVHALGLSGTDVGNNCVGVASGATTSAASARVANGIQIFPGSVPIYRGSQLIGGIGVSGDGVDQDDMIALLAVHQAGQRLGTVNNAPPSLRADTLTPRGHRLRYVNCPQAPFLDSDTHDACGGK